MAPLFTNLAMWAGVFMLVALMKLEADDEGVEDLTATQAYLGRWLLLAVMAAAQGLIVTVGDLVIGVQTVSPVAFVATGVIASVTYSAVAYMLAITLLHVGKALIMVMIIVQIPGAGGCARRSAGSTATSGGPAWRICWCSPPSRSPSASASGRG